jgi:hypothetical protein
MFYFSGIAGSYKMGNYIDGQVWVIINYRGVTSMGAVWQSWVLDSAAPGMFLLLHVSVARLSYHAIQ